MQAMLHFPVPLCYYVIDSVKFSRDEDDKVFQVHRRDTSHWRLLITVTEKEDMPDAMKIWSSSCAK